MYKRQVFVCGLGDDGLIAREFAMRLSLLGLLTIHHADPILMMSNLSAARRGDAVSYTHLDVYKRQAQPAGRVGALGKPLSLIHI